MMIFRLVFGLLAVASIFCFAAFVATGHAAWRRRGFAIVKWTLVALLGFFGVLMLERLVLIL